MLNGSGITALEKPWLQPKHKLGAAVRTSAAPAANGFRGVRKHPDTVRFDAQLEDDDARPPRQVERLSLLGPGAVRVDFHASVVAELPRGIRDA